MKIRTGRPYSLCLIWKHPQIRKQETGRKNRRMTVQIIKKAQEWAECSLCCLSLEGVPPVFIILKYCGHKKMQIQIWMGEDEEAEFYDEYGEEQKEEPEIEE